MNRFKTKTLNGGLPFLLNDLRWILGQEGYATAGLYKVLEGYLNSFGTDFIISGCVAAGAPGAITEGWIFLGGEIIKVDAHTGTDVYYEKITDTYHADGNKTFQDGTTNNTYQKIRAKCTAVAGVLKYNGDTWDKKINDKFGTRLLRKVIEIGDWDMDAGDFKSVVHGIPSGKSKIKAINAIIREDGGTDNYDIHYIRYNDGKLGGGIRQHDDANVTLYRTRATANGFFDSADFNQTSFNRGWITIWYEE